MKTLHIDELSVFLPCYNEEKNVAATFANVATKLKKIAQKWEIILINDGSKDGTAGVLQDLKRSDPEHVVIVTHPQNRGYGAAFKSGVYIARYAWIALIDSDGQFDFNDISKLINLQNSSGADLVIGYYLGRKVSMVRIFGSKLWQLAVFILFGLSVRDIDCGFKLFKKQVIDTIPKLEAERGPFITSEFLIKAKKAGFKIVEIGVNHYSRQAGEATGAKLNVILSGFKDLFRLWYKINFSVR